MFCRAGIELAADDTSRVHLAFTSLDRGSPRNLPAGIGVFPSPFERTREGEDSLSKYVQFDAVAFDPIPRFRRGRSADRQVAAGGGANHCLVLGSTDFRAATAVEIPAPTAPGRAIVHPPRRAHFRIAGDGTPGYAAPWRPKGIGRNCSGSRHRSRAIPAANLRLRVPRIRLSARSQDCRVRRPCDPAQGHSCADRGRN
jgi:hypothetical protein